MVEAWEEFARAVAELRNAIWEARWRLVAYLALVWFMASTWALLLALVRA